MKAEIILVVEDNATNMKLFKSLLHLGKFHVLEAGDAETGIRIARTQSPDLILMDIQLPGIDGLQATRLMKDDPDLKGIPIVALTSHAMRGDEQKARDAGCDGYITKPINTRTFLNELLTYLHPQSAQVDPNREQTVSCKPQILIVDDEPINVKLMSAILSSEQFAVVSAQDGMTALEIISKEKIDLILLDVMMPGIDGYQVTQELKNNPQTKNIPVILVTALHSKEDKIRGLQAGADEFLTKPVNKFEIIARVKSMLKLRRYQEQMDIRKEFEKPLAGSLLEPTSGINVQCVLLVDDNPKDLKLIQQLLSDEPYSLRTAKTGEDAISIALSEEIDLILLDVILPGLDGYKVCQFLKNSSKTRDIQILMVTCLSDLDSRLRGVEEGVDDFFVKPIDSRELKSRINTLLKKKAYLDQLHSHREETLSSAISDRLTRLYNQGYFKRYLEAEISRSLNRGYLIGLIIADLDDFKKYNDAVGYPFGDEILREFANIIKRHIRETDFPARYSGERFAVVFPYAEKNNILKIAESIRKSLEQHIFAGADDLAFAHITTSIGVAFCPEHAGNADDLIEKADYMLYRAKKLGKNRVFTGQ